VISRIESVYLALPLPALFPEKMNELMVGILQGRMPIIRTRLIFQGLRHPCRKISVELLDRSHQGLHQTLWMRIG
jgi:hypothetical protein